ncbi:MAG: hypothetical protein Q9168_002172 [Polycauliona sp. 1 TL-2023]
MSGTSNVGGRGVYEAGDQRNVKDSEKNEAERFKEGQPNSHKATDSKDERSIANKLERESKREDQSEPASKEAKESQADPTLPAKKHGNEPSKGAKIDAEIQQEEEEMLKKKGIKTGNMGQGFSLTTLSSGPAGIDVPELSDLSYEKALGQARLMKSIRARHQHGLVVVKLVMKPYPQLDLGRYVRAIRRERDALSDVPNALPYQRVLETTTNGYLVRQYLYSSLYDRMSTRPFLEDIEKKWLAFQLLCALRDCHARNVFHGDIKTENILVTSWNWLYLTDFSSSYKKTRLPEDNPADFSYYFDTSGRRTCYLAPERFLSADEDDDGRGLTWAMDVFSVGCVIAELFLESPIFTLSQLYKYRKGEFDPGFSLLDKIQDTEIRELVNHMIQLDPESRYAAEEYLNFWRRKAFPEYFYSFLHQYMGVITDPSSGRTPVLPETSNFGEADDRIDRVYVDFDKISFFLGYENEKERAPALAGRQVVNGTIILRADIPDNGHIAESPRGRPVDDGSLIFLTLIVSSLRNTARATAKLRACDLLLAFAQRITDEAKLDRVLPYVTALLNDRSELVRAAAVRTIAQLLAAISVVSPVNANVFTEYIRPRLQNIVESPTRSTRPLVRTIYAKYLATLAHSSSRVLDLVQALRNDGSIPTIDLETEDGVPTNVGYQNLFDVARRDLLDYFEGHTKNLLTDDDASVRRAFLDSVSSLCIFLGSTKASDVVLSHLNTYLNDRDWTLKCAFCQTVVGVATFIGGTGLEEFILPVMVQALTDPEEFVVEQVLSSLASMAELGLFQRVKIWEMVDVIARFSIHPNIWIREAAVHFISASTQFLSVADIHCMVLPLIRPYIKFQIVDLSESSILNALKRPLPRNVMELAMTWATKNQNGLFWKSAQQQRTFSFNSREQAALSIASKDLRSDILKKIPRNEEDDQWFNRLRNLGMVHDDDIKLVALRDYIWHMSARRSVDDSSEALPGGVKKLRELGISPHTVFFETKKRKAKYRSSPQTTGHEISPSAGLHTLSDALLEATTTLEDPQSERRNLRLKAGDERIHDQSNTVPPPQTVAKRTGPNAASPAPSSLSEGKETDGKPTAEFTGGRKPSVQTVSPDRRTDEQRSDGTVTPTDSLRPAQRNRTVRHKSSAIDLLRRKDTVKSVAETGTTPANAFGLVDVSHKPEVPIASSPTTLAEAAQERQFARGEFRTTHTYDGNDPNILKLLDTLASEHYPLDMLDFGPPVLPVGRKSSMKKGAGQESDKPWRPEGTLIATFGEHTASINRVLPSPDHAFFLTASDDGSIKIWDTLRLERNLAHRSRQTHEHAKGARVKCVTFVENTHTFVSGATDGSIHVIKVDHRQVGEASRYGKLRLVREYQLPKGEYAIALEHYRAESHSTLVMVTDRSRVLALDLRDMSELFVFENAVHHGTPTCFCLDPKHHWLVIGTTHGVLDFWDIRWKLRVASWGLGRCAPIRRIHVHPFRGKGRWVCVTGGTGQTDISIWDLEKGECREVYRAGGTHNVAQDEAKIYDACRVDEEKPERMLGRFAASVELAGNDDPDHSIRAMALGTDHPEDGREARYGFFLTGGPDKKLRFWDVTRVEVSKVVSGLESQEEQPRYTTSHPTSSLLIHTEKLPRSEPSAPNAAAGAKASGNMAAKKASSKQSRSTAISQEQQHLLKNHLDTIMDVALLENPVRMVVSVDRAGIIKVYR